MGKVRQHKLGTQGMGQTSTIEVQIRKTYAQTYMSAVSRNQDTFKGLWPCFNLFKIRITK